MSSSISLQPSPNVIRVNKSGRMIWAGHVARMEEMKNTYNIPVAKAEGKRSCGTGRRRWEDNIRMDLRKIGWEGVDWINLAQDRNQWRSVVNTVMNLRVSQKASNFLLAV